MLPVYKNVTIKSVTGNLIGEALSRKWQFNCGITSSEIEIPGKIQTHFQLDNKSTGLQEEQT